MRTIQLICSVVTGCLIFIPLAASTQTTSHSKGEAEGNADYAVHATSAAEQSSTGYVIEKNVMVAMRDGTKLATDIYRPAKNGVPLPGKFPVIVDRSPYNKEGIRKEGIFFAQHGYVEVAQDCRGRFASQGTFYPLLNEGRDGYDTIEWAATQPWSDGKIGTAGASYGAWTQYTAAMEDPPHLVAMFPVVGGSKFFPYSNGIPDTNISQWILFMAQTSQEAAALPKVRTQLGEIFTHPDPWLKLPPAERAEVFQALPQYEKIFRDMFYFHPTLDSYWRQQNFYPAGHYRQFKDVPMYFISGWYDGSVADVIQNFVQLSRLQKSPKRLMVGPWPHGTGRDTCGEAYFGSSAAVDEQALELDWFNHWMKGEPFRLIGGKRIRVFRMGGGLDDKTNHGNIQPGGTWLALEKWPPNGVETAKFYLQPQKGLKETPPQREDSLSYEDNPALPVPTHGGQFHAECVQNQATLEQRSDVLSFTTAALKTPVAVTGDVKMQLWIASTAPDTDFMVKLSDVYPDGYSMILTEGQIRARYRNGMDKPSLMQPGTVYSVPFDVGVISNLFAAGHRIRVDISSTDFPRLEPNSNTGAPPARWSHMVSARNTIYFGGRYPSSIQLPVQKERHP